jgi:RNA polymerase sigma-70 factor (ECF subfamily)
VTPTSLHDALFERLLERARDSDAPTSSAHKPGVLTALRATGWRVVADLRQAGSRRTSAGDAELARAFRAGDADAFDELFARYHGKLIGYARRAGCSAEAEDLAQEAFTALARTASFDDPAFNVPAYLFTVVRNNAIKLGIRRAREHVLNDASAEVEDPSPGPLEQLIATHSFEQVVVAIEDRCTPAEQSVLSAFHVGSTTAEIAVELQTTAGNVRVIRHRAIIKLRAALDEELA